MFPEVDIGLAVSRQPYFLVGPIVDLIEELKQWVSQNTCSETLGPASANACSIQVLHGGRVICSLSTVYYGI